MSVALINTPEPSLRVTIENAGDIPVLVRVGNGTSAKPDHLTLRGYLTEERGKTRLVVFGSGVVFVVGSWRPRAGRGLRVGGSFQLRTPKNKPPTRTVASKERKVNSVQVIFGTFSERVPERNIRGAER